MKQINIVFEGVNGSGKSSTIEGIKKKLDDLKIPVNLSSDINKDSMVDTVLEKLYSENPFLHLNRSEDTSIAETMIFLADHHHRQSLLRKANGVNLFDRDLFTIFVYQNEILKKSGHDDAGLKNAISYILNYDLKKIDLLVYVDIDFETSLKRTQSRDKRLFDSRDQELLKLFIDNLKKYTIEYSERYQIPLILLDGKNELDQNIDTVFKNKIFQSIINQDNL